MNNPSNHLPVLASKINRAHAEAREAAFSSLKNAIQAGEHLIDARAQLKHGQWLPWLRDNCKLPERTARLYMRLARHKDIVNLKSATVADLTIRAAIDELVEPKWPAKLSDIVRVLRCLPEPGTTRQGVLPNEAGRDYFFVDAHPNTPKHFFVTHIWVPNDPSGSTCERTRKPIRADLVRSMIEMHCPTSFFDIDWYDVPQDDLVPVLEACAA